MSNKPFAVLALLALAGCGFTPLYGGAPGQQAGAGLDAVEVQNLPNRTGQMLRQTLEERLHTGGAPVTELYSLSISYVINQTGEGIQADSSTTRNRFNATAIWRLTPIGNPHDILASGNATAMDALNVIDQQYFASNLETETVNQQLADQISDQITAQLAAWFRTHPNS